MAIRWNRDEERHMDVPLMSVMVIKMRQITLFILANFVTQIEGGGKNYQREHITNEIF